MEETQIVTYLEALGQELIQRGFPVHEPVDALVAGGAYMLLKIHNRPATEDIDVLFLGDDLDLTRLPLSKKEKTFKAAVSAVAKQYGLKRAWLNDDAGPFLAEYVPNPTKVLWRSFGPLRVYLPDNRAMLAYKLLGYSAKQQGDIYALCKELNISTYEEVKAIMDDIVPLHTQKDFDLEKTMMRLF